MTVPKKSRSKAKQISPDTKSPEYNQGVDAYLASSPEECSHLIGQQRIDWFSGYYHARSVKRLGAIFRKYGVEL